MSEPAPENVSQQTARIIACVYYNRDDVHAATPAAPATMGLRLRGVVDGLVKIAIEQGSVLLAESLLAPVRKHLGRKPTAVTCRILTEATTLAARKDGRFHAQRQAQCRCDQGLLCERAHGHPWVSIRCFDSQASNGAFAHIPTHVR